MSLPQREVQELIQDARVAVHEATARSRLSKAWELLQERDANGNALWALPYTEPALAEFEAAHGREPDDVGIVHHLAIAHHARAWDLELRNDAGSADAWKIALNYWQMLAASSDFRNGLEAKLLTCDPNIDPAALAEVLLDLPEKLLDVHIAFIGHYSELGEEARALSHVELVKQANLKTEIKERFIEKVFEAQTGSVAEAKANQSFASARTTVERFLQLFPDHLAALRLYIEVCTEWLKGLGYKEDETWEEAMRIADSAKPFARRLEAHPRIKDDPLAMTALETLSYEMAYKTSDRGEMYFADSETQPITFDQREGARKAFALAIEWCRIGKQHRPEGSTVNSLLAFCLDYHAMTLIIEAKEVLETGLDTKTELTAAIRLYRQSVAELEEAVVILPDSENTRVRCERRREDLAELESRQKMMNLFGSIGGQP